MNCREGWRLRMIYLDSLPDNSRPPAKLAYEQHIKNCDTCHDYYVRLGELVKSVVHPELER